MPQKCLVACARLLFVCMHWSFQKKIWGYHLPYGLSPIAHGLSFSVCHRMGRICPPLLKPHLRVSDQIIFYIHKNLTSQNLNKAFVGLGSCDNVQTERKIFEYANWPRLQIKRAGPSSWSVQLVCAAVLSSWSVQLVCLAVPSSWSI